jgi:hypothetical protein
VVPSTMVTFTASCGYVTSSKAWGSAPIAARTCAHTLCTDARLSAPNAELQRYPPPRSLVVGEAAWSPALVSSLQEGLSSPALTVMASSTVRHALGTMQRNWHCPLECGKSYQRYRIDPANHVCYEYWCQKCHTLEQCPGEQKCYVRAVPSDTPTKRPTRFGVYDFESTVSNADMCVDYTPTLDPACGDCEPTRKCSEHERCNSCRSPWCGRRNASVHSVN